MSKTTRPKALIFGTQHHLVVLCKECSSYARRVKRRSSIYMKIIKYLLVKNHMVWSFDIWCVTSLSTPSLFCLQKGRGQGSSFCFEKRDVLWENLWRAGGQASTGFPLYKSKSFYPVFTKLGEYVGRHNVSTKFYSLPNPPKHY